MADPDELEPLDPSIRAVLDADRDLPAVPADQVERMWLRLDVSVAALGDAVGSATTSASTSATATTAATPIAGKLLALAAAAGLAIGGVSGYALRAVTEPVRSPAPLVADAGTPAAFSIDAALPIDAGAADAGLPIDGGVAAPAPSPGAPRAPRDPQPAPPVPSADAGVARPTEVPATASDAELAAENALISQAQSALARGRSAEALAATDEHVRRFARGRFAEEREVLAIQALVKLGRRDEASRRADRFFATYPGSFSARAVRAALEAP